MESQSPAQGLAPGLNPRGGHHARSYVIGLAYALVLTAASFWAASSPLIYGPSVPVLLGVLAIAQMGIHLTFFLQISSAPDQTNNFLALAFGIFITGLVVFGSMMIMSHLSHATVSMDRLMQMQR